MLHEQRQFDALEPKIRQLERGIEPYPHCVEIHPTDFCNQACSYCFHGGVGEDTSRRGELLTVPEYIRLVDELESLGVAEISVSGGGEPLLYRGIAEVLGHIAASRLALRLVTNGNHIPVEVMEELARADEVRVSIDSLKPDVYDRMRGLRGGNLLQRTLDNLRTLVQERHRLRGGSRVAATFLLSDVNLPELESFAKVLIEDIGVDSVVYKWDIYGRITTSDSSVQQRLRQIKEVYGTRVEIRGEIPDGPVAGPCVVPYVKVAFNPYGELYSCCLASQPGETNGSRLGSLRAAGAFHRLWTSATSERRSMRTRGVSCRDCNHTDRAINNAVRPLLGMPADATARAADGAQERRLLPLITTD
jgi:MoaA/NifB/PqqE/SkfB family radical SAM enzyme